MQLVINAVQGDPEDFGGVWWDSSATWPLHIAYVSDDPAVRAGVEQWIPPGGQVQWHRVTHSYATLDSIQNEIVAWWNANPNGHGDVDVNSVGVDVIRNRVTVRLVQDAPAFESDLIARHGDAIEFVIEPAAEPL